VNLVLSRYVRWELAGEENNTRHDRNLGAKLDSGTTGRIFDDLLCEGKYVLVGKDALINLFNKVAVSKKKSTHIGVSPTIFLIFDRS
jgi:hypothetical protein